MKKKMQRPPTGGPEGSDLSITYRRTAKEAVPANNRKKKAEKVVRKKGDLRIAKDLPAEGGKREKTMKMKRPPSACPVARTSFRGRGKTNGVVGSCRGAQGRNGERTGGRVGGGCWGGEQRPTRW